VEIVLNITFTIEKNEIVVYATFYIKLQFYFKNKKLKTVT